MHCLFSFILTYLHTVSLQRDSYYVILVLFTCPVDFCNFLEIACNSVSLKFYVIGVLYTVIIKFVRFIVLSSVSCLLQYIWHFCHNLYTEVLSRSLTSEDKILRLLICWMFLWLLMLLRYTNFGAPSAFHQPSTACSTSLPAQHLRPSGFSGCRPHSLELSRISSGTRPSVWTVSDGCWKCTCSLDNSAFIALEVLTTTALYKFTYLLTVGIASFLSFALVTATQLLCNWLFSEPPRVFQRRSFCCRVQKHFGFLLTYMCNQTLKVRAVVS